MSDRSPATLGIRARSLPLAELIVGAAIMIAHNVYHIVPNKVPILFVLGILSIRFGLAA